MDTRRFGDLRENMKPDPQTLATRYRLNLLPKKRNFALVKKPRKKTNALNTSTDSTDSAAKPKSATSGSRETKTETEENKTGQEAVFIGTSCWKIDEAADDDSNSDDEFEDDLRPESHQSNQEFQAQQTYHMMCKVLCIRPIKNFHNALVTDTVAVCYQPLTHDEMKACATALVHTDNVEKVIFDDNNLGPMGTARLAEILPLKIEFRELVGTLFRELTIKNNKIGSDGAKLLCTALLNNNHVRKLDVSGNEFCEEDGAAFGELLEENNALREIDLSHNNFRCRGGQLIADGLAKNRFLKKLDLSWNHLRMDGAVALGESLMENSDLEELRVAWNGFHLRGCMAIGHALTHNSSLLSLDLTCNRISELCLSQLLKGLPNNTTLQVLKLPLNPLSPQSAYSILQFIDKYSNMAVSHVDLGDQCVYDEFKTFLEEIQKSRDLEVIHGPILKTCLMPEDSQDGEEGAEGGTEGGEKECPVMDENPLIVLMEFCRLQNLRLVDMFNNIDKDRSKSLSYQEFQDGLQRVNIPLADHSLQQLMMALDRNKDGEIDFAELIDGQREYKRLVQDALRDGPMDSNVIGQIGIKMKHHIHDKYLMRKKF